ncbi:MAG: hypothetical protein IJI10_07480, partial [Eubacterium sp.]|nr:hypothetical protein [Eubacterium sp.]
MSGRQQRNAHTLRYIRLLILLLLAFAVLWYRAPAARADDGDTGTEQTQEGGSGEDSSKGDESSDAGGGDIEKPSEGAAVETNKGSATVAEVVQPSSGSGSSGGSSDSGSSSGGSSDSGSGGSSGGGETNTVENPAPVNNDPPSVTVTESYTSTDTSDVDADETKANEQIENKIKDEEKTKAGDKEYKLTEGDETIREEDHEKVDDIIKNDDITKTVTYKQSDKTGEEGKETVTLTKTTVTKSENAVQKAINDALKKQLKEDTKYITITVAAGTYDGDIKVAAPDDDVKKILEKNKNFQLYLLGEGSYTAPEGDAVIDKTTIGATSGTDVVVKGGLNIDGINAIIAGIYFSMENRIKITGGSDVTIYGTKEDDGIFATLVGDGNSLTVDTGEGDDSIKVETEKEEAKEGEEASTDFKNVLKVLAGDGKDSVVINHNAGVLDAEVDAGDGEDKAEFKAGSDAKRSYTYTESAEGDASDGSGEGNAESKTISGSMKIDMGAGDDSATINASLGQAFENVTVTGNEGFNTFNLDGKLNKDGKLNGESDTSANPIAGEITKESDGTFKGTIRMIADSVKEAMAVIFERFNVLLDTLENKPEVDLKSLDTTDIKSFVNYKYDPGKDLDRLGEAFAEYAATLDKNDPEYWQKLIDKAKEMGEYKGIKGDWSSVKNVYFTNLLIEGNTVLIDTLNIPAINLQVKGKKIEVNGAVTANVIVLAAYDNDQTFNWDSAPETITNISGDIEGSLFDFVSSAEITVNKDGSLTATNGSVTLTAATDQTRKLIDLLGGKLDDAVAQLKTQPVNVKVGNANINIYGSITAAENITASTKSNVNIEASNASLASLYVPVAVVVSVTEANIDIDGATLTAKNGNVTASAEATASLKAEANTGTIPLSLAVAVAIDDAHVNVNDSTITAGKDVTISANGSNTAEADAKRGDLKGDTSVYISADVAIQDVSAEVDGATDITAGGKIDVTSTANLKGTSSATSAKADSGDEKKDDDKKDEEEKKDDSSSVSDSLGTIKNLLVEVGKKLGKTGLNWAMVKLGLAADNVSSKAYKVSVGTTEHGTVSAPASANGHKVVETKTFEAGVTYYTYNSDKDRYEKAEVTVGDKVADKKETYYVDSDPVRLVVTPDSGYKVKELKISYLEKGATSKTVVSYKDSGNVLGLVRNEDGSFSFKMPEYDVSIAVEFETGNEDKTPEADATDAGLADLFDESTSGTQEEEGNTTEQQDSTSADAVELKVRDSINSYELTKDEYFDGETTYYIENDNGGMDQAEVTTDAKIPDEDALKYYERIGSIVLSAGKLDPKSVVTITPNPAKGYALKKLVAVYKTPYLIATEKKFEAGKEYWLLINGVYVIQIEDTDYKVGNEISSKKAYYYKKDGETRTVEQEIAADSTGAYKFEIPEAKGLSEKLITFVATFGKADGTKAEKKDPAKASTAQSAGALAVGVNLNYNTARITSTGTIKAGDDVTVETKGGAEAKVVADGTAVEKDEEKKEEEAKPGSTSVDGATQVTAEQTIVPYTVYIAPTKGAGLAALPESDATAGKYIFKVVAEAGKSFSADEGKVTFTYNDASGEKKTGTASLNTEKGQYTVDLSGLSIKAGTQVVINLDAYESGAEVPGEYLVANTVKIASTQDGSVTHLSGKTGSAVYAFGIKPATGYTLKGKEEGKEDSVASPYLTYEKKDGTKKTVALTDGGKGNWYFKVAELEDLKEGSEIVVSAEFEENKLAVDVAVQAGGDPSASSGKINLDPSTLAEVAADDKPAKAIEGNTVKFTVNSGELNDGQIVEVSVHYTLDGESSETVKKLTAKDGVYSFVMPNAAVKVVADFYNQIHRIAAGEDVKDRISIDQTKVSAGQTVTIKLTDEEIQKGSKITAMDFEFKIGDLIVTDSDIDKYLEKKEDGSYTFKIPARLGDRNLERDACTFTFNPTIVEKPVTVKAADTTNGTINLSNLKTEAGETYKFTVNPNDGYKIKKGSVVATITVNNKTESLTVKGSGTDYTVTLPAEVADDAIIEISAAFTPGVQEGGGSGKDGKNTMSVGASVAVGILINNHKAYVENATINAKGLTVNAENKSSHTVEAKAGYSEGDIGIGGAIAVNVAVVKANATIGKSAKITLADGELNLTAKNENEFETTGDAKGDTKAKKAGVGAGIAVAVTGTETKAILEDGVKVAAAVVKENDKDIEKKIENVNVNADTTENATVQAFAGSAGGISITPVLALQVGGTETKAEIGKYNDELICDGDVNVGANSDLFRQFAANAAASGSSVSAGGAFTISVLNDSTNAKLARSTKAKNVNVKTKARNRAKSTSRASANGAAGKDDSGDSDGGDGGSSDGDKSDSEKSGVDKQADGILGGAGKLAGHVNAGGTSGENLKTGTANRQSASTSEGSIDIAGALALNIQFTEVKAEIADGITVKAGEDEEEDAAANEDADSEEEDE